jgi:hypothetical protein
MTIDVNNILTHYGKTSLIEEKTIDINNILTKHGKKLILEKDDDEYSGRKSRSSRKKDWKNEIYSTIDSLGKDNIFKLNVAYKQEKGDKESGKFQAIETVIGQFIKVTAKLAKALILTRDKYYDPSKLQDAARFVGPRNDVTGNMAQAILDDIDEIDKKFKLNFKLDKKLNNVKRQTKEAEGFLEDLVPYVDWIKFSKWKYPDNESNFKSVGDMLVIGGSNGKLMSAVKKHAEETN